MCVFFTVKPLVDPALSLIEKLGDVASSLTSLTQKPGKEGEKKRGENTLKNGIVGGRLTTNSSFLPVDPPVSGLGGSVTFYP